MKGSLRRLMRFDSNVENFKRRQALPVFGSVDEDSKLFFERLVDAKKNREFIFITKAKSRNR